VGDVLGDRTERLGPLGHRLGQLMRERCEQADVAVGGLGELRLAERAAIDHVEHEGVDLGPYRLHEVERERLAPFASAWTIPSPGSSPTAWHARIASASTSE
jgi:hypothetical protein